MLGLSRSQETGLTTAKEQHCHLLTPVKEAVGTHSCIKMRKQALPNAVILCFLVKRDDH